MLRRNIKKAPQHTKAMAVNTLMRPKVEYSSAVWDPYTKDDITFIHVKCHFPLSFPFNKFIYVFVGSDWHVDGTIISK
jgi:hypothetical protein